MGVLSGFGAAACYLQHQACVITRVATALTRLSTFATKRNSSNYVVIRLRWSSSIVSLPSLLVDPVDDVLRLPSVRALNGVLYVPLACVADKVIVLAPTSPANSILAPVLMAGA